MAASVGVGSPGPGEVERLVTTERLLLAARCGVVAAALLYAALGPRWSPPLWATLVLVGIGGLVAGLSLRAPPSPARLRRMGALITGLDAVAAAGLIAANPDHGSVFFVLALPVVVEAALRYQLRGGAISGFALGTWAALWPPASGQPGLTRLAVAGLVGVTAGAAVRRLGHQREAWERTLAAARATEEALRTSEARFRAMIQHSSDFTCVVGADGLPSYVSPAVTTMLGFEPEELIGAHHPELIHPDDVGTLAEVVGQAYEAPGATFTVEYRSLHRDGRWRNLESVVTDLTADPHVRGMVMNSRDVTEQRQAQHDLAVSERRYRSLFDRNPDAVFSLDLRGHVTSANAAFHELFARGSSDPTQSLLHLLEAEDRERVSAAFRAALRGEPQSFMLTITATDTTPIDLHITNMPIVVEGEIVGVYGVAKDFSERRSQERRLAHQAFHDDLTGLPNRALFLDRLAQALLRRQREIGTCAVLFLDLDRFKTVNDNLGHQRGDELLVAAAGRLRSCLRASDTLSRFGGDEFTLLVEDVTDPAEATVLAERLLGSLAPPFLLAGHELFVSASVGVAVAAEPVLEADELLRRADSAMYQAKNAGRSRVAVYDAAVTDPGVARLAMKADLHRAVQRDELVVHYQPQVSLLHGRMASVEAVLRWQHPEHGLLAAEAFLPVAEEAGLLVTIGQTLLATACCQLRAWWDAHGEAEPVGVAINVSTTELARTGFADHLAATLATHGLPHDALTLEITERVLMEETDAVLETLSRITGLGVRLAVDNFGTGSSSLVYLKRFPVDIIKVDRAFVNDLGDDEDADTIVAAVVGIARTMHLVVVGEGVQNEQQLERLVALGCHVGQGDHLSPVGPPEAVEAQLAREWDVPVRADAIY